MGEGGPDRGLLCFSVVVILASIIFVVPHASGADAGAGRFGPMALRYSVGVPGLASRFGEASEIVNITFELNSTPACKDPASFSNRYFTAAIYSYQFYPVVNSTPFATSGRSSNLEMGASVTLVAPRGSYEYMIVGSGSCRVTGIQPAGTVSITASSTIIAFGLTRGSTYKLGFVGCIMESVTTCNHSVGATACLAYLCDLGLSPCGGNCTAFENLTPSSYPYELITTPLIQELRARLPGESPALASDGGIASSIGNIRVRTNAQFALWGWELYNIKFNESGLPPGTEWTVRLTGSLPLHFPNLLLPSSPSSSNASSILLRLPNGSFQYRVTCPGYSVSVTPTPVKVSASAVVVSVTFTKK